MNAHDTTSTAALTTHTDPLADSGITFIHRGDRVCVLAAQLSPQLGYDREDQLACLIAREWAPAFKRGEHYDVLRGTDLAALRRAATAAMGAAVATGATPVANPIGPKVRAAVILYESGADLACAMSRKPEAVKVRAAIAARVLPAARRAALPEAVAPTPVLANDVRIDARLDRILGAVEALVGVVALLARPAAPPALALPAPVIAEAPAAPAALPAPRPVMPAAPATQTAVQTTTGRWLRPGQIAAVAQAELARETTAYAVGLAITALGLRGDATASRTSYISLPEGGEREVHSWCPTAQRLVIDYLRGQSPGRVRRNQEARDRRADIAEGAQQVLDGLGA